MFYLDGEPLGTMFARVRFLARVDLLVGGEMGLLRERFAARLAHVRSFARVRARMRRQGGQLEKTLRTLVTLTTVYIIL